LPFTSFKTLPFTSFKTLPFTSFKTLGDDGARDRALAVGARGFARSLVVSVVAQVLGALRPVHDDSEEPGLHARKLFDGRFYRVALGLCPAHCQQHAVHQRRQECRVGHGQDGRRVEEDHVKGGSKLLEQAGHARRVEQLCRVRVRRATGENPYPRCPGRLDGFLDRPLLAEDVAEANLVAHVQDLVHDRPAQIGIDDDDTATRVGQGLGEIGHDGRLALARLGTGDQNGPQAVGLDAGLELGLQAMVGLLGRDGIAEEHVGRSLANVRNAPQGGQGREFLDLVG
jgi:hypothetical protein